ncbi:DNA recombination protein RmuC [Anderseniella sp. Alg231-50]|uniref:DNA recombination protein RmuC n=1 Tax=Anderseniella sp. Alg231-50 TaxID=1922226 RepID=UPI000D54E0BF
MDFSETAILIGETAVTWGHLTVFAATVALALLVATVVLAWRAASGGGQQSIDAMRRAAELETKLAEMSGQLRGLAEHSASTQAHLTQTLDTRLDQVSQRLGAGLNESSQRTTQSLQKLNERLAVIDTAQTNLTNLSSEMLSLRDILANKQSRGAYGQARMEAIIRDGLHSTAYSFQTTLSNGTRPDCLVRLPENDISVVIDAKFPLEGFNALKQAGPDEDPKPLQQRFRADVLKHIKDISEKYLLKGETHETAIMFVPSESIYADLHENFEDIIQRAHRKHVIIASPNVLMLLVQTMQAVFKDARMREQAVVIQTEVVRLMDDVGRMHDRVLDLQRHFGQAGKDIEKIVISSDKISRRGAKIEQVEFAEPAQRDGDASPPRLVAGE